MSDRLFEDKRLLDALEYIDDRYVAEVAESYRLPGARDIRTRTRKYLQLAVRAACILLIAGLMVSVPFIIEKIVTHDPGYTDDPIAETLTEEDLVMINEFFAAARHDPSYVWAESVEEAMDHPEYRGKYGECIVIYAIFGQVNVPMPVIVGNYRFYGNGYTVLRINDESLSLLAAYENGLLQDNQIENILRYRMDDPSALAKYYIEESEYICQATAPIELTADVISDIVHSYFKYMCNKLGSFSNDSFYTVRCFGKFDGAYAVIIEDLNVNGAGSGYTDEVNGVEFISPYDGHLWIYRDGELTVKLGEAYEKGILSQKELEELAKFFNENIAYCPPKAYAGALSPNREYKLDKITVALMPFADASEYTAADFSEIGCTAVEPLLGEVLISEVNLMKAKQLQLTLSCASTAELAERIELLRRRGDIYSASAVLMNDPTEFTEAEKTEIADAYLEMLRASDPQHEFDPNIYEEEYRSKISYLLKWNNGCYAIAISGFVSAGDVWSHRRLNGYDFRVPFDSFTLLKIYCGGNFHTFEEAFRLGYIDDEFMREFIALYTSLQDYPGSGMLS